MRGISLHRYADLDAATALAVPSPRHGEDRLLVLGLIEGVLHAAVTLDRGADIHVISLRRASRRERQRYTQWLAARAPR